VKILWTEEARKDYNYWHDADIKVWKHLRAIIRHTQREPYRGLGRPKKLQYDLKGWWARNITRKDRLVYRITRRGRKWCMEILLCRGHYQD
jgi:toxin YoeB